MKHDKRGCIRTSCLIHGFYAIQTRKFILKEVFTKKDRTILSEKL